MTLSNYLSRMSLARYAVLGAVALSILPVSAASLPLTAQEMPKQQGGAGPKQSPEQQGQDVSARVADAGRVTLPPRVNIKPLKDLWLKGKLYEGLVWNSLKVSASGKHLVMKLEMTREAAGNLLLKQIMPN